MKITKGDWKAVRDECHYDSLSDIYAGDKFIASVNGETIEEQEANTRLMAAAPDMLKTLEMIERAIADGDFNSSMLVAEYITGAIAKARGENE
jgi:23S rRNA G2069 N7-methylase RlmK/C1962 C5-methylase RlmI